MIVAALYLLGVVALLVAVYRSAGRLHRAQAQLDAMRALHRQRQHHDLYHNLHRDP